MCFSFTISTKCYNNTSFIKKCDISCWKKFWNYVRFFLLPLFLFTLFIIRHKVDGSAVSKQLPTLILYEGGKETKRRPLVDRRGVITPYTFTEVCEQSGSRVEREGNGEITSRYTHNAVRLTQNLCQKRWIVNFLLK